MSHVVKFLPGLIAAAAAFVTLKLITLFDAGSLFFQAVAFLAVYLIVAILADKAIAAYGKVGK